MQLHLVFLSSGITRLVLGIVPIGIFPRTPSFTNLSSVDSPDPLIGHSYRLHTLHDFVGTRGLTFVRNVLLLSTHSSDCLSSSVRNLIRRRPITCLHLDKVPEGLPSYILRTGSGRTDGRDVYGVIRCVPLMVVFGVGTQRLRRPVMTHRPNAGAGGGCYLFPSKFVCTKVG